MSEEEKANEEEKAKEEEKRKQEESRKEHRVDEETIDDHKVPYLVSISKSTAVRVSCRLIRSLFHVAFVGAREAHAYHAHISFFFSAYFSIQLVNLHSIQCARMLNYAACIIV
jgi:ABC-type Zn2+ transport system substrate-binding protein/surface adhesin